MRPVIPAIRGKCRLRVGKFTPGGTTWKYAHIRIWIHIPILVTSKLDSRRTFEPGRDICMRKDITFSSGQDKCEGWFYQPDVMHDDARLPLVVMAHGFSGVKEQGLAAYAEKYLAAGFAVLVFDFRHFGGSSGEPRCQLFPLDMVEDYRNAITWACLQPVIDANRVGLWGTSFSGGIATYAATIDPRVKAVVAQAPSLMNAETRRAMDPDKWQTVAEFLTADRVARYEAGTVNTIPVVAPDGTPCALMGQESYEFFEAAKAGAPTWRNEITLESLEKIREFDPVSLINMLSPTALLVIAALAGR